MGGGENVKINRNLKEVLSDLHGKLWRVQDVSEEEITDMVKQRGRSRSWAWRMWVAKGLMDVELLINKKKFFLLMVARGGNCPFTSTTSLSISHQY